MMIAKHPTLNVEKRIPDADADRWRASGWTVVECELGGERGPELLPAAAPCPTCGAEGDDPCVTFHTNVPTTRHAAREPKPGNVPLD